jgi:hypothetical protein
VSRSLAISNDQVRLTPDAPDMRVSFAADVDWDAALPRALDILSREGVVVLDDLVDPALLDQCRQYIINRYPDHAMPDAERYLGSYPGRHTAPLVIDEVLANREIFMPAVITEIAATLLGRERILESFGLLVSRPGSPNQGRHHDGLLFPDTNLDRILPCFALSVAIPLVPLDEVSGTTAFWRQSHRKPPHDGPPDFAPSVMPGSALVWDFRTHHSGRGNAGDVPRPILFSVHSRDWWQEPKRARSHRYHKLQVSRAIYDNFDKTMRDLLVRADIVG